MVIRAARHAALNASSLNGPDPHNLLQGTGDTPRRCIPNEACRCPDRGSPPNGSAGYIRESLNSKNPFNNFPFGVGKAIFSATVKEGEIEVVEPEQVQDRRV